MKAQRCAGQSARWTGHFSKRIQATLRTTTLLWRDCRARQRPDHSGAPGTALALARMSGSDNRKQDHYLATAIETTRIALEHGSAQSFCLCHGLAGNAEILIEIARLTSRTDLRHIATQAAEAGMHAHHESGNWPCGIRDGGNSPGLMLGLAGIGLFYLRLHDPTIDSPLLL
jgi:lantibiotic modifying enzyme